MVRTDGRQGNALLGIDPLLATSSRQMLECRIRPAIAIPVCRSPVRKWRTHRIGIDDMRLIIDALEPESEGLPDLLADLRFRLEPQLRAAGLRLNWDIAALPPMEWLTPAQRLDILRVVQEAITNSLKHARAHEVCLKAVSGRHTLGLSINDDGFGFDIAAEHEQRQHRGIQSLYRRAGRIGGKLTLDSAPGQGTKIVLWLPLSGLENSQSSP